MRARAHLLPCLLLVLAPLLIFHVSLLGLRLVPGPDLFNNFAPWRAFWAREVRSGRLPLWDPHPFCGAPFITNLQTGQFYPPDALSLLLHPVHACHVTMALHLLLLGLGVYALGLRVTKDRWGAACAAFLVLASQHITAKISYGLVTHIYAVAWLPWVLLLVLRLLERPTARRVGLLGTVVALQVLAGHPQWVLITGYAALALVGWRLFVERDRAAPALHRGAALAGAGALGIALPAVHLWPALSVAAHSATRAGGATYAFATIDSLPPASLATWTAPFLFGNPADETFWLTRFGYHEIGCATGVVSLLLAGLGLCRRDRATTGLLLAFAAGVLLALGGHTPLYRLAYHAMPGVAFFRVPARWLILAVLALALLTGRGLVLLREGKFRSRTLIEWAGVLVLVHVAALTSLLALRGAIHEGAVRLEVQRMRVDYPDLANVPDPDLRQRIDEGVLTARQAAAERAVGTALLIAVLALAAAIVGQANPGMFAAGLAVLLVLEVLVPVQLLLKQVPWRRLEAREFARTPAVRHVLQHCRGRVLMPDRTIGVHGRRIHPELFPERGTVYGMRTVRGYNPTIVGHYARFFDRLCGRPEGTMPGGLLFIPDPPRLDRALLDRMAADYVLAYADPGPGFTLELTDTLLGVYRNDQAWPRAALVDPARDALLDVTAAHITTDEPNRVVVRVECDEPAALVLLDTIYPGWEARGDGVELPIEPYQGTFRQVRLGPGTHEVEFRFRPRAFRAGAWVSGMALAGLIALVAPGRTRSRTARRQP